jgi:hypothetical protein
MEDLALGLDESTVIYDGTNFPNVREFTAAAGLVTGQTYSFTVRAVNFNGAGPEASPLVLTLCAAPAGLGPPTMSAVSRTTMTLTWSEPESDGGCRILSYALRVDDGSGPGAALNPIDAATVAGKPTLRTHTITSFAAADTGKSFRLQLEATNAIGAALSREVSYTLAAAPDPPASGPTRIEAATSTSRIGVAYAPLPTGTGADGGSAVLGYELQMYDYGSSSWSTLLGGEDALTLVTSHTHGLGLEKGGSYMFRYRAWNINGAGDWSDVSHLIASSPPARPPRPTYGGSTADSVTVLFRPSGDDGGELITSMQLEVSPLLATAWQAVTTYTDMSMSHVLTVADDGLVAGALYRLRISATNARGTSPYSLELPVAVAPLPGRLDAVVKVQLHSSSTSITVRWAAPTGESASTLGYRLKVTDVETQLERVIYDAPDNRDLLEHSAVGLTPGASYAFSALAVNFNGAGEAWSEAAVFRACSAPVDVGLPTVTAQSASGLAFEWPEPRDSGGCPTTAYELYVDANAAGALSTSVYSGAAHVRAATIALAAANLGQRHRFRLEATNHIGTTSSLVGYALYAAVPAAPSAGPASDPAVTTKQRIGVTWAAVDPADTGGSEVLSYGLEMDDGAGGDFSALAGAGGAEYLKRSYTASAGVEEGVEYRFRHRARNAVGWSGFSPITYIRAAAVAERPPAPQLLAPSSSGLTLAISPSSEDGGAPVTGYRLFRDDGAGLTAPDAAYIELAGYDGASFTYVATVAADGLELGKVYRFVAVATNAYGDSPLSLPLIAGVGAPPTVAAPPVRATGQDRYDAGTNTVGLLVTWQGLAGVTADLPVLGFQLLMDDGLGGDDSFQVVFDGGFNPLAVQAPLSGLNASLTYRFTVRARDVNGLGPSSPAASSVACLSPADLAAPSLVAVGKTAFEVAWRQPGSTGGCPLTSYALYLSDDQDAANPTYVEHEAGIAPTQLERAVTFGDGTRTGKVLRLKVEAVNQVGSLQSPALQFVLADVPGKPAPAPSRVAAGTTAASIEVAFTNANADLGGLPSCTYELEMDDGDQGDFAVVFVTDQESSYSVTAGIERGKYYRFRYRARNSIGYSEHSDVAFIQAVDSPAKPAPPVFVQAGDDSIEISIVKTEDTRGVDILEHQILIDAGDDPTSAFRLLDGAGSYDGLAATYTLTAAVDALGAPGTVYRIKVRAKNTDDALSEESEALVVALGAVPAAPALPFKDDAASGPGEIAVGWTPLAAATLPLLGYRLYSDLGLDDGLHLVYDGQNKPTVTDFLVSDVSGPLVTYKFAVTATNFNGEGAASPLAHLRACTLPSSGSDHFPAPELLAVTSTSVTISWRRPSSDGGCTLIGYALYVDDADGVFSEYEAAGVRAKPHLSSYVIDMAALGKTPGETYRFRVGAANTIGEVHSDTLAVLLASVPGAPAAPTKTALNDTHVRIVMSPPASDGGATITSYELQLKPEEGLEAWESVLGAEGSPNLDLFAEVPLESAGQYVLARYRCANEIGWSSFSPSNTLLLARVPSPPPRPVYLASAAGSLTVEVQTSVDNGGSVILLHEVWTESGGVVAQATSYDGSSSTFQLTGLTSGQVYRVAVRS